MDFLSTRFVRPFEYQIQEGNPTLISCCQYQTVPEANVQWFEALTNTFRVQLNEDSAVATSTGELFILDPQPNQNTVIYGCIVSSSRRTSTNTGYVVVNVIRECFNIN